VSQGSVEFVFRYSTSAHAGSDLRDLPQVDFDFWER